MIDSICALMCSAGSVVRAVSWVRNEVVESLGSSGR